MMNVEKKLPQCSSSYSFASYVFSKHKNQLCQILIKKMETYIFTTKEYKKENRGEKIDTMVQFGTHFPRRNCSWICLRIDIIGPSMKPISIAINLKVIIVLEFIHWMMLQVLIFNLIIPYRFCLIFKPSLI